MSLSVNQELPKWKIKIIENKLKIENFYLGGGYGTLFLDLDKIKPEYLELLKKNQITQELREFIYTLVD